MCKDARRMEEREGQALCYGKSNHSSWGGGGGGGGGFIFVWEVSGWCGGGGEGMSGTAMDEKGSWWSYISDLLVMLVNGTGMYSNHDIRIARRWRRLCLAYPRSMRAQLYTPHVCALAACVVPCGSTSRNAGTSDVPRTTRNSHSHARVCVCA